jgi:hypothetical protein
MAEPRPGCPDCGIKLVCPDCDDTRPTAEQMYEGWRILSPFHRWETVTLVRDEFGPYGPVLIWTKELGPGAQPWRYTRWTKMDAIRPPFVMHGTPEIRVYEHSWPDGPIYAVATMDTVVTMDLVPEGLLVQATTPGRGKGWTVSHRPVVGEGPVVIACPSKAKARTQVRALARAYAKTMHVKVRFE